VRGCVCGVVGSRKERGRADIRERVRVCERGGVRVHGCKAIQHPAEDGHADADAGVTLAVVWDTEREAQHQAGPAARASK
jgi:hypothetical protein